MNIRLDADYVITSDEQQIILNKVVTNQTEGENFGKEYQKAVGYYSTIEDAINGYVRKKQNASQATSLNQLINEIRDLRKHVHELITAK